MTGDPAVGRSSAGAATFYEALLEDDPDELYETAPCGYLSTLPDGTIIKANATFLRWTGFERNDLVGRRRFQDLLPAGDRIFYETHFAPSLRMQGTVREIAVEVVSAAGDRLPVLVNAVVKLDERGDPLVTRIAVFDARERRSYEQELLAARREAEESEARARSLARTLQETFLPPIVISIPDLDVGGAYHPAGDGSEVGGDFYDVFETGRGSWGVVLGDVCGKGAQAAVVTALARYTVRAEAVRTPYPSAVLAALHDALLRDHPDRFCTAVFGIVTRTSEGRRLTLASGGHHLPLRARGGDLQEIGDAGTILGMLDTPHLTDVSTSLLPGDVVVLYTDGVIEARNDGAFFDESRLRAYVGEATTLSAQELAEGIARAAIDFQDGIPRDDIAVIVLKVPQGPTASA